MKSLPARLFNRKPREDRAWTETFYVEEPSTPVTRYVNFMLIQMSTVDSQTKILNRNEELPPLTAASDTLEPPPLDAVVKRLKEMCDIKPRPHSTPVEGTIPCTIEGVSFDVKCHFDDVAEACCWIQLEKSDEIRDFPSPDDLQEDASEAGGHRAIRYGSPEYKFLTGKQVCMSWRQRVRRSAIYALICVGVMLGAQIAVCLMLGESLWNIPKMVGAALITGAFIFALMLFGYAQQ
jgi:hypothetical protein